MVWGWELRTMMGYLVKLLTSIEHLPQAGYHSKWLLDQMPPASCTVFKLNCVSLDAHNSLCRRLVRSYDPQILILCSRIPQAWRIPKADSCSMAQPGFKLSPSILSPRTFPHTLLSFQQEESCISSAFFLSWFPLFLLSQRGSLEEGQADSEDQLRLRGPGAPATPLVEFSYGLRVRGLSPVWRK